MAKLEFILLPIQFRLPEYTWDRDGEACRTCGYYLKEGSMELCSHKLSLCQRKSNQKLPYCIDSRLPEAPCGPGAGLRHAIAIS